MAFSRHETCASIRNSIEETTLLVPLEKLTETLELHHCARIALLWPPLAGETHFSISLELRQPVGPNQTMADSIMKEASVWPGLSIRFVTVDKDDSGFVVGCNHEGLPSLPNKLTPRTSHKTSLIKEIKLRTDASSKAQST